MELLMKFKNVAVLGIVLSLLVVSACKSPLVNLPEPYMVKRYSYEAVVRDICSKNEKACVFIKTATAEYVAFIEDGFLFIIDKDAVNTYGGHIYSGVGTLKQIMMYRNIYMAVLQDGSLMLADAENHFIKLMDGCIQVEQQNNDIIAIKNEQFVDFDAKTVSTASVVAFDADGDNNPLVYESFACEGGLFRRDTGWFDSQILTSNRYNLAKSNMVVVYSAPANDSKAPKTLKKVNGVWMIELANGEVIPYKKK
jgi:hypothetical protein